MEIRPKLKVSSHTGKAVIKTVTPGLQISTSLQLLVFENKLIYFSTKTYVVGTQNCYLNVA